MASVTVNSLSPIFGVNDLAKSLDFYQRVLGFSVGWSWGDPAELASVCRDAVEITLAERADARPEGRSRVYVRVSGIDAYLEHIERAGGSVVVPIGDRSYGMRDFRVADPDGNELDIGEEASSRGVSSDE